jgi:nuclear transport factor 2 (NTF2) superfamily protein
MTVAPLTRADVLSVVREYGLAWTTQDPDRIGRLFTDDAVYVERPFHRSGTFRGRAAIRAYWAAQICGKQRNITFRHVAAELVLDAEARVAVVKWLAEFDNLRHLAPGDARDAHKRVRFCQLAKVRLDFERFGLRGSFG